MSIPAYIIITLLNLILIFWSRYMIVDDYEGTRPSLLNRGYCIIWITLSCIPLVNIGFLIIFTLAYIMLRCNGDWELKDNKFNDFWFKH